MPLLDTIVSQGLMSQTVHLEDENYHVEQNFKLHNMINDIKSLVVKSNTNYKYL